MPVKEILRSPASAKRRIRRSNQNDPKKLAGNPSGKPTGYQVLPQLKDSLYHLMSCVYASCAASELMIHSMIIKGNQLFVHYNDPGSSLEETMSLGKSAAAGSLQILNIGDGKLIEQLGTVYQVKTPLNVW